MRKRNHTVTIRMNNEEYNLLQNKVKESGRTQQEVVIKAIADLKIASTEEVEELKRLNQMFADILSQLRGATTNINQIARSLNTLQNIFQTQDIIDEAEGIKEMISTAISLLKENREVYEEFTKQKKETEKQLYRIIKKREVFEFLEIDEKEK